MFRQMKRESTRRDEEWCQGGVKHEEVILLKRLLALAAEVSDLRTTICMSMRASEMSSRKVNDDALLPPVRPTFHSLIFSKSARAISSPRSSHDAPGFEHHLHHFRASQV